MSESKTALLFVCLGNICRSPMAKGLFTHLARRAGELHRFEIDSCGTGPWHAGRGADPRTLLTAAQHGVPLLHTARQIDVDADVAAFDIFLAMDQRNKSDLIDLGVPRERVRLIRSFDLLLHGESEHRMEVPDPYYGGQEGFVKMYEMLHRACEGLLAAALRGEILQRS